MSKPREYLHTKVCLAAAVIAAVENLRDDPASSDFDFRMVSVPADRGVPGLPGGRDARERMRP